MGTGFADPRVGVDGHGDAVAIWENNGRIFATARASGQHWAAAVALSGARSDEEAHDPALAIDPDGDAVVVWRLTDGTSQRTQAATRPAGGRWSAPG